MAETQQPRNPFGCLFAARYLEESDEEQYLPYLAEEPIFDAFCLDNHTPQPVPYHYAQVRFQITKRQCHGPWSIKTKTYETHYISLAYFGEEGLGLSIEDYIDVTSVTPGKLPFKRTDKHPVFAPVRLRLAASRITYYIQVLDICFYGRVDTHSAIDSLVGYNDYLLLSPPLLWRMHDYETHEAHVPEYEEDPLQWC